MIELVESGVVFNREGHTYTLGDKVLCGITARIRERVAPDEYVNVPRQVLESAANRGSLVHEAIERMDKEGVMPDFDEIIAAPALSAVGIYAEARRAEGLRTLYNEFVCTDGHSYATCIDAVMTDAEGDVALADYKTVSALNKEMVSWQLSTEAYFLEKSNKGLSVGKLYAVWLRHEGDIFDSCSFIQVPRKNHEQVEKMLYTDEPLDDTALNELISAYVKAAKEKEKAEAELEAVRSALQLHMEEKGVSAAKTDQASVAYRPAGVRKSFDSKRFQKEHEDMYKSYVTETPTKASIVVRMR